MPIKKQPVSDTPETDALLVALGAAGNNGKFAEHARKLERERDALALELKALRNR